MSIHYCITCPTLCPTNLCIIVIIIFNLGDSNEKIAEKNTNTCY